MSYIQQKFEIEKATNSDINEHLQTLKNLGDECQHITEMGVRGIVSTWALLASKPKKFVCYDISILDVSSPQKECYNEGIDFKYLNVDVLEAEIESTDLLFIDTLHRYLQLKKELELHAPKVKKYIALHDTTTYGQLDEPIYQPDCKLKNLKSPKQGLIPAIQEFLETKEGKNWQLFQVYENNNGLTVLRRNCD